jgi:hypothetical protein
MKMMILLLGLDCEWQPMMDNEEVNIDVSCDFLDNISSNYTEKRNRPNTFQIATRNKTFVVEVKNLVDVLSESCLKKFGDFVLFNDNIIKLGKILKFNIKAYVF